MIKIRRTVKPISIILIAVIISVCMLSNALINGSMAYAADNELTTDPNFNYNGYNSLQLKAISDCISDQPNKTCPSYTASTHDDYTVDNGTINTDDLPSGISMPTGVINTKAGWLKWADTMMKANNYDGVYGTLEMNWNNSVISVKFRLIGINHDNRADGSGKAGLTFQAIGYYTIRGRMNNSDLNAGGWRDTLLRKNLNDESTGTIWDAIQSTNFKNNIAPVLKTTNNSAYAYNRGDYNSGNTSNASSITVDKLFILSPSEIGMPIMNGYHVAYGNQNNAIKSSSNGNSGVWSSEKSYIYSGDTYKWWMLPAGSRKMSNGNQAYHNTDSYSYCALATSSNPSINKSCNAYSRFGYYLRSPRVIYRLFSIFSDQRGGLTIPGASENDGVIIAFAF